MVSILQYFEVNSKLVNNITFCKVRKIRVELSSWPYIICNAEVDNPVFRYVMKQVAAIEKVLVRVLILW